MAKREEWAVSRSDLGPIGRVRAYIGFRLMVLGIALVPAHLRQSLVDTPKMEPAD